MNDDELRRLGRYAACPTGKIRYRNKRRAQDALLTARINRVVHGHRRRTEWRYYPCDRCSGYHLTSKATHQPRSES